MWEKKSIEKFEEKWDMYENPVIQPYPYRMRLLVFTKL
jgi:hypothetical protein